jgi:hypothetical protein
LRRATGDALIQHLLTAKCRSQKLDQTTSQKPSNFHSCVSYPLRKITLYVFTLHGVFQDKMQWILTPAPLRIFHMYKVVQIWPGQTVTCLHTNSPGHIWTTLYKWQNIYSTKITASSSQ